MGAGPVSDVSVGRDGRAHDVRAARRAPGSEADASSAIRRTRLCYWDGEAIDTPAYDGTLLRPGHVLRGPAIIEERTTTIVVPAAFTCSIDERKNYVLQKAANGASDGLVLSASGMEA